MTRVGIRIRHFCISFSNWRSGIFASGVFVGWSLGIWAGFLRFFSSSVITNSSAVSLN